MVRIGRSCPAAFSDLESGYSTRIGAIGSGRRYEQASEALPLEAVVDPGRRGAAARPRRLLCGAGRRIPAAAVRRQGALRASGGSMPRAPRRGGYGEDRRRPGRCGDDRGESARYRSRHDRRLDGARGRDRSGDLRWCFGTFLRQSRRGEAAHSDHDRLTWSYAAQATRSHKDDPGCMPKR